MKSRKSLPRSSAKHRAELRLKAELHKLVAERDTPQDGVPSCVACDRRGDDVHEIVPLSHFGHNTMAECLQMKNACVICRECHSQLHNPAGRTKILGILQERHGYRYDEEPWRQYIE